MNCTICIPNGQLCSHHRTASTHWAATYADRVADIVELKRQLRDGDIDFSLFEMAS